MSGGLIIQPEPGKHLAICVPSGDDVKADFCFALANMMRHICLDVPLGVQKLSIHNLRGSVIQMVRQRVADDALVSGATHLLWIDSDMLFPPDAANRLLSWGKPMVGINAVARRPPFHTTARKDPRTFLVTSEESTGIEKAHSTGFAMVLIEAQVFRAIGIPYFEVTWRKDKHQYRCEDYDFFEKAREAGYELWIDHDLSKRIAHVGTWGLTLSMASTVETES